MSLNLIYSESQKLSLPVRRSDLESIILRITGQPKPLLMRAKMDERFTRGFFVRPNTEHPLSKQFLSEGSSNSQRSLIVTSRELPHRLETFIYIKELIHLFDDPEEMASSQEKLEFLLGGIAERDFFRNACVQSEIRAGWIALSLFCPEFIRKDRERRIAEKSISIGDFAEELKLPTDRASRLIGQQYVKAINSILGNGTISEAD